MDYVFNAWLGDSMEKEYKTKDLKAEKVKKPAVKKTKVELPIFQKRQHWCFVEDGKTLKFMSEELAKEAYLAK